MLGKPLRQTCYALLVSCNVGQQVGREQTVTVDVTPNGRGDAVNEQSGHFVLPEERQMHLHEFFKLLAASREDTALGKKHSLWL